MLWHTRLNFTCTLPVFIQSVALGLICKLTKLIMASNGEQEQSMDGVVEGDNTSPPGIFGKAFNWLSPGLKRSGSMPCESTVKVSKARKAAEPTDRTTRSAIQNLQASNAELSRQLAEQQQANAQRDHELAMAKQALAESEGHRHALESRSTSSLSKRNRQDAELLAVDELQHGERVNVVLQHNLLPAAQHYEALAQAQANVRIAPINVTIPINWERYNGSRPFVEWLETFASNLDMAQVANEAEKLRFIKAQMSGQAAEAMRSVTRLGMANADGDIIEANFAHICTQMAALFPEQARQDVRITDWWEMRVYPGEAAAKYLARIRQVAWRDFPGRLTDADILENFCKAIAHEHESLANEFMFRQPANIAIALRLAERCELNEAKMGISNGFSAGNGMAQSAFPQTATVAATHVTPNYNNHAYSRFSEAPRSASPMTTGQRGGFAGRGRGNTRPSSQQTNSKVTSGAGPSQVQQHDDSDHRCYGCGQDWVWLKSKGRVAECHFGNWCTSRSCTKCQAKGHNASVCGLDERKPSADRIPDVRGIKHEGSNNQQGSNHGGPKE